MSQKSIRSTILFLFSLLMKWRGPTIIIAAVLSGWSAYYFASVYTFAPIEIAITINGIIAALAFLKISVLIITYPFLSKPAFEASLLVVALLTALLFVIAVGAVCILIAPRVDTFPATELIWLLPLVFAVVSIFLFATFHLAHSMFKS